MVGIAGNTWQSCKPCNRRSSCACYPGLPNECFHPIVFFIGDCELKTELRAVPDAPEGIILHGHSFGAIPALAAARRDARVCGLILESAIADLSSFKPMQALSQLLGIEKSDVERWTTIHFDHRACLSDYRGPTLVMHCRNDHFVPFVNAEQLYEWASEPKTLKVFERGDHNTFLLLNFQEYLTTLKEFLMRIGSEHVGEIGTRRTKPNRSFF